MHTPNSTALGKVIGATLLIVLAVVGWLVWSLLRPDSGDVRDAGGAKAGEGGESIASGAADSAATDSTSENPFGAKVDQTTGVREREEPVVRGAAVAFVGRVLAEESGVPLAGVRLTGRYTRMGGGSPGPASPEFRVPEVVKTVTGSDGRYRLVVRSIEGVAVELSMGAAGRARLHAEIHEPLRAGTIDSGDVMMPVGVELTIRVRDQLERPVRGMWLVLNAPRRVRSSDGLFRTQDAIGEFEAGSDERGLLGPFAVVPGEWQVSAYGGFGHRPKQANTVRVTATAMASTVDFEVVAPEPEACLSGVVVDSRGKPVPGVRLMVAGPGSETGPMTRAGPDGEFCIADVSERVRVVRVDDGSVPLFGGGPGLSAGSGPEGGPLEFDVLSPIGLVPRGMSDVRVVVRPVSPGAARVRVVDRAGEPIERFRVGSGAVSFEPSPGRARGASLRWRPFGRLRFAEDDHHPGGVVEMSGLRAGRRLLVVVPTDELLVPVCTAPFDTMRATDLAPVGAEASAAKGSTRPAPAAERDGLDAPALKVAVEPAVRWQVRVVDSGGRGLVGVRVEFVRSLTGQPCRVGPGAASLPVSTLAELLDGASRSPDQVITSSATTDGEGYAALRTAADTTGCAVRILGKTVVPKAVRAAPARVSAGAVQRVVVDAAARVVGTVGPATALADILDARVLYGNTDPLEALRAKSPERTEFGLELQPVGGDGEKPTTVVLRDGTFAFDSVPVGSYRLVSTLSHAKGVTLGEAIALQPGETRTLDLDVAPLRPVELRGRVTLGGEPPGTVLSLVVDGRPRFRVARDGTFDGIVTQGPHLIGLSGTRDALYGGLRVNAQESTDGLVFAFERRVLTVRLQNQDGGTVRPSRLRWSRPGSKGGLDTWLVTRVDSDGQATLISDWSTPMRLTAVFLTPKAAQVELGTITWDPARAGEVRVLVVK